MLIDEVLPCMRRLRDRLTFVLLLSCTTPDLLNPPDPPPSSTPPSPEPTPAPIGTELERVIQENGRAVLGCYEVARAARPAVQGEVALQWTVAGGVARDVQLRQDTTGDRDLAACVAAEVGRWRFAGVADGVAQHTWSFPAPEAAAPPAPPPSAMERALKGYRGQLAWCHERALRSHPDLGGELRVSWTLVGGRPTAARAEANTTGDAELEACVLGKVGRWVFTGVDDGRQTHTFVFGPTAPR